VQESARQGSTTRRSTRPGRRWPIATLALLTVALSSALGAAEARASPPSEGSQTPGVLRWQEPTDALRGVLPSDPGEGRVFDPLPPSEVCGVVRAGGEEYGQLWWFRDGPVPLRRFGSVEDGYAAEVVWVEGRDETMGRPMGRLLRFDEQRRLREVLLLERGAWVPRLHCGPDEGGWLCSSLAGSRARSADFYSVAVREEGDAFGVELSMRQANWAHTPTVIYWYDSDGRLTRVRDERSIFDRGGRTLELLYDEASRLIGIGEVFERPADSEAGEQPRAAEGPIAWLEVARAPYDWRMTLTRDDRGRLVEARTSWPNASLGCLPDTLEHLPPGYLPADRFVPRFGAACAISAARSPPRVLQGTSARQTEVVTIRYAGERLIERRTRSRHVSGHDGVRQYRVERYGWDAEGRLAWQVAIDASAVVHFQRTAQHLVATFEALLSYRAPMRTFIAQTTGDGTGDTPWVELAPHGLWDGPPESRSSRQDDYSTSEDVPARIEGLLAVHPESEESPWGHWIGRDRQGRPTVVMRPAWPEASVLDYDEEGRISGIMAGKVRSRVELHYDCDTWPELAMPPLPNGPWREEGVW